MKNQRSFISLMAIIPVSGWLLQTRQPTTRIPASHFRRQSRLDAASDGFHNTSLLDNGNNISKQQYQVETTRKYNLGLGKNRPVVVDSSSSNKVNGDFNSSYWIVPDPVAKPATYRPPNGAPNDAAISETIPRTNGEPLAIKTRRMVARDNDAQRLRGVIDEEHFNAPKNMDEPSQHEQAADSISNSIENDLLSQSSNPTVARPKAFYPDIDLSIPDSVYCPENGTDLVWDLLRWEAYQQAQQEPLLVSFLHSTILNHRSLESSLAFLLANRLQSPAMMISTQLQSLILEALKCSTFRRALRADMMAVRDRDPACAYLPDVFLYFKGFHALQSHRVAHVLWEQGRQVLALYLQSQVSQIFQIDIHPNATLGRGIMLDHGTGIVIGETASVGHNCSILHHVTLGGSGKKGLIRHPQVGDGVLLGAGATVLGSVSIGDGSQVGAGTLVIVDLPPHCVAVGVPARIIGSFVDVTQQPSRSMDQMMDDKNIIFTFESDGI
ncbi:hypothetical protein MPSEU_000227700 [Mayamaea pseudoterrestris]|nr:hypothetical protein MPSEU_000227700 [Mayamaea pseudoterrestris]